MMRALVMMSALIVLAACARESNTDQLEQAAEQSDPAAAAVLENAAENGMDPQQALQQAGNAQAAQATANVSVQARPNLPGDLNPPEAGQPPEKVVTNVQ
ncbi:MAG TPA: hypothetical protein VGR19_03390 [Allosphingosinicella sp.]|nr:hypothetical protein [Allosphingosinicella sp.]